MTDDMTCSDSGCSAFRFDTDAALREGWGRVAGETYCSLHAGYAAFIYTRSVRFLELKAVEERRALENRNLEAKKTLTRKNYRAWDEFQQDLADFHKKEGRLAHKRIRLLQPREFMKIHGERGRIDIAAEEEKLQAAEDKAQATRKWLTERLHCRSPTGAGVVAVPNGSIAEWSSSEARWPHKPQVVGSNPTSATG